MKKKRVPKALILNSLLYLSVLAYAENGNTEQNSIIKKGNIYTSIENSANVGLNRNLSDNQLYSTSVAKALALTFTYFVIDKHAVMLGLSYDRNRVLAETGSLYRSIVRTKMVYLGYQYAHQFSKTLAFYGALQFGIGAARDYFKYLAEQNDNDNKALQTAASIELGAYFIPFLTLPFLLQPKIAYSLLNKNLDNRIERNSGLFISAAVVASLTCNSLYCRNPGLTKMINPYRAGLFFLSSGLSPFLQFGKLLTKYENTSYYETLFNAGFRLAAGYFFIKYVAAMTELNLFRESNNNPDNGYSVVNSGTKISLGARAHVPVENCFNNLFAQALFGFGRQNSQSGSGDNIYKNTDRLTFISLAAGYNLFITPYLALTSMLFYDINRSNNTVSNIISQQATFGIRLFLSFYIINKMQTLNQ